MKPPPQHLAPHLKTRIKNVLFPYKEALSEKKWKTVEKEMISDGVYDKFSKKYLGKLTPYDLESKSRNARRMIPGTTIHFVQEAIRLKVNITADNHGEYKPNREQLEAQF